MIAPTKNKQTESKRPKKHSGTSEKVGAVLVIGGGIAGIQGALDLAESGQKVYLLENSPAIGGNMARLDKTFPTNDCAMCILSPKIVECGRHLNIETITWADLEEVSGSAGHFTAKIRKRARFVDLEKCTGCGECVETCPVSVASEFEAEVGERKAIFRPYPQAYPNTFVIDKRGKSPCRVGCPAGININGYIALTAAGKYEEALKIILETAPLPGVLGRVCDHPCELECHLGCGKEPVSICAIKRFLADYQRKNGQPKKTAKRHQQELAKVAIIGSGPAGLTAARELARKGYRPVIFEALSKPGGMIAWGIPDYRLPPDILEQEIQDVLDEGVELICNTTFGLDITLEQLRQQDFEAVILALGAQAGSKMGLEGEQLENVVDCIAFLREVNSGRKIEVGKHVTIIGGGNSAIDSARSALRLGAKQVTIVYRRSRTEMPAIPDEIETALREGVKILYLAAPERLSGKDGKVSSMECIRMKLGAPDESGRRRPVKIPGSEFTIETDMVIPAIGQKVILPDGDDLKGIEQTRWGTINTNPADTSTNLDGVFAIGDAVTGPQSVIKAIAQGRIAAQATDCYLRGANFEPLVIPDREDITPEPPDAESFSRILPRQHQEELSVAESIISFDEVEHGLTQEQARTEAQRCLKCAVCSECMACVEACKAEAICQDQRDVIEQIDVGSIIVLPGFKEFLAGQKYDYGYSRYDDVVSSIQFERILSASGPFAGHIKRPSDGKEPKKIAFLQCIGSRDISCRNAYCSSVCCMYAIKEAVIAKEHLKDVDVTIFFMDLRAFGKDFDKYYERAKSQYGVHFKRARVCDVYGKNGNGELTVKYAPESGQVAEEEFDMVVLSVGLEPSEKQRRLASQLGIRLDSNGFIWTNPLRPLETSRPGIFVGGTASGPKDIPETVIQASATASEASQLLADVRNTLTTKREFPPEIDVSNLPPRIGVFVCHCGINIGSVVDVPVTAEYAKSLPYVVYAEDNLYTCSQDTQDHIREMIAEHKLNRVVVASCSPRTHEPLFQQTLREAGLNPHLFEMANIRDQCSWVHMNQAKQATNKAKSLVRMAVAKVTLTEPLSAASLDVTPSALVIGGGLAGMTAALSIANQGFEVTLVERQKQLGGNLRNLRSTFAEPNVHAYLAHLQEHVQKHKNISVYTGTEIESIEGFVGNFQSILKTGSKEGPRPAGTQTKIEHGAIIVATGGNEHKPDEYLYGQNKRVVTQLELEGLLADKESLSGVKTAVFIQCVGSREEEHMYCSRVCCSTAVKNALKIKELSPETEVYVLYRDIRTYGFDEQYFQTARDKGVIFVRYEADNKPKVTGRDKLKLTVREPLLDCELILEPDLLVLSSRIDPNSDNEKLAQLLKVPVNEDRFFLEAHVKLRPVEFATEGIFVAGLAHNPKSVPETIAQAKAAASKACIIISQDKFEGEANIAKVDINRCSACGICTEVCAYKAVEVILVDERLGTKAAFVNPALCKGCGTCCAICRSGAIDVEGISNHQIDLMIKAI
jgi:heterodisulfide reductase subunit A-like polyferredoxin